MRLTKVQFWGIPKIGVLQPKNSNEFVLTSKTKVQVQFLGIRKIAVLMNLFNIKS